MSDVIIPKHVAIIMDGNRRWAKQRNLPVVAGHKKVVEERIEELIEAAAEQGVEYLTMWAFSTENWGRGQVEVGAILQLFRWALQERAQRLIDKGARVRYIGDLRAFPEDIQKDFEKMMRQSETNTRINVTFALNYGGRDELLRAVGKLLKEVTSQKSKGNIVEQDLERYLDTAGMPDPDLIIRTSGEQRLSGFMPWQSVYAELYFPLTLMPDFGKEEFDKALEEYARRNRRFGRG